MTRPGYLLSLAAGVFLGAAGLAAAAGLTDKDNRFLDKEFGPAVRDQIIGRMTAAELATLHDVMSTPFAGDYPGIRYNMIADYLFTVHMQQCQAWSADHPNEACPPPKDPQLLPGQNVADQQCNACHLFGTSQAPSFRKMAQSGIVTDAKLADAIKQGHQMSPIYLSPAQVKALVAYIGSLK